MIWRALFKGVLGNILEDIDFYITGHKQELPDRPKAITAEILNAMIGLIAQQSQDRDKFSLLVSLYLELVRDFIVSQPNSILAQTVIDSLNMLREKTAGKFERQEWDDYVSTFSSLFEQTNP
mgnify:FL=1